MPAVLSMCRQVLSLAPPHTTHTAHTTHHTHRLAHWSHIESSSTRNSHEVTHHTPHTTRHRHSDEVAHHNTPSHTTRHRHHTPSTHSTQDTVSTDTREGHDRQTCHGHGHDTHIRFDLTFNCNHTFTALVCMHMSFGGT